MSTGRPDKTSNNLTIRMESHNLDNPPPYAALSYAWGSSERSETIEVHGRGRLALNKSLHDALLTLAGILMQDGLALWADGICINQGDHEERAEQVAQMGNVYSKATCVPIWLGPSFDGCAAALRLWGEYAAILRTLPAEKWWMELDKAQLSPGSVSEFGGPPFTRIRPAIEKLMKRSWWSRVWIIQESFLAQRLRCFCGESEFDFEDMRMAMLRVFVTQVAGPSSSSGFNLFQLRDYFRTSGPKGANILDILGKTMNSDCQDPRDRLYGILSLVDIPNSQTLKPCYSVSTEQVYTNIAVWILKNYRQSPLAFLAHVRRRDPGNAKPPSCLRLPSWVPDWTIGSSPGWWPLSCWERARMNWPQPLYIPSPGSAVEAEQSGAVLQVKGRRVDEIVWVAEQWVGHDYHTKVERSWQPTNPEEPYPTGTTYREAWLHCICAGRRFHDFPLYGQRYTRGAMDEGFPEQPDLAYSNKLGYLAGMSMKLATELRVLFKTKLGFMGLGPWDTEAGDSLCVFYGGPALYLLRRSVGDIPTTVSPTSQLGPHSSFHFVGESYVYGLMDGEAMNESIFPRTEQIFNII